MDQNEKTGADKVIEAAVGEFAIYGYEGARVDRIARSGSINKAMIYYYFKNKEGLYANVLQSIFSKIIEGVQGGVDFTGTFRERLEGIIDFLVTLIFSFREEYIVIIMREIASGGTYFKRYLISNLGPLYDRIFAIFEEAEKAGEIRPGYHYHTFIQAFGSLMFFNMIKITATGTELEGRLFPDNYVELFRETLKQNLLEGVLKRD